MRKLASSPITRGRVEVSHVTEVVMRTTGGTTIKVAVETADNCGPAVSVRRYPYRSEQRARQSSKVAPGVFRQASTAEKLDGHDVLGLGTMKRKTPLGSTVKLVVRQGLVAPVVTGKDWHDVGAVTSKSPAGGVRPGPEGLHSELVSLRTRLFITMNMLDASATYTSGRAIGEQSPAKTKMLTTASSQFSVSTESQSR